MGFAIFLFVILSLIGSTIEKHTSTKSRIATILVENQFVCLILAAILTVVHIFMAHKIAPSGPITFGLILLAILNMYLGRHGKLLIKNWILLVLVIIVGIIHVATL